jgi:hypothetical protein
MQDDKSLILIRHQLGSIDLSDIDELKNELMSDTESSARAGDAELFYTRYFEKVLKLLTQYQLEFIGTQAKNIEELGFGRGTINGLILIKEWFDKQVNASRARFSKEEKPKPGDNPVSIG